MRLPDRRTQRRLSLLVAVLVLVALALAGPAARAVLQDLSDDAVGRSATTTTTVLAPAPSSTDAVAPPPSTEPPSVPPSSAAVTTTVPAVPTTANQAVPVDGVPAVPEQPATALIERLIIGSATDEPYRRAAFGDGWNYDRTTGCNTRGLVLLEESSAAPTVTDRCKVRSGAWTSSYDGMATTDPADLEIDHLVPLADAWRSGADRWSEDRRRAFANDLDDPATLQAVSQRSNRSKGDSTPNRWLPEDLGARCRYVEEWIRVKARWELTVTAPERATLVLVLSGC